MTERQQWWVSFDVDHIKQYLLATTRLRGIRGASSLLRNLDDQRESWIKEVIPDAAIVYSAGGGAAVLVSDREEGERLIAHVTRRFRAETITASISGILLPPLESTDGQQFGWRMKQAVERLRQVKAAKAEMTTLPVEPYLRLCKLCGQHPAVEHAYDRNDDWLCKSCAKKLKEGGRNVLYDKFREYAQQGKNHHVWTERALPEDLDHIGTVSLPINYIGFIMLDGNHIGDLLGKLGAREELRAFSQGLEYLTKHQTFTALQRYGQPRQINRDPAPSETVAPFEIVLMGGDDVVLITAADIAMDVALVISEGFERDSRREVLEKAGLTEERDRLTMAGGIVLAHADFPIPAMYSLTEALQKSAKKFCASHGYKTGALDFLVVSGGNIDVEDLRRNTPQRRPYTLEDMRSLLRYIRKFKKNNFPMSQLHSMYQALFSGEINAQLASITTLAQLARNNQQTQYNLLRSFFRDFKVSLNGQLPPWDTVGRDGRKVSALTDLVELYPFIRLSEEERENAADAH